MYNGYEINNYEYVFMSKSSLSQKETEILMQVYKS